MNHPPPTFGKEQANPVPFGDRLSALCSVELAAAKNDPDRAAEMIERLLNSLAFTIAIAAKGDPKGMNDMLQGAEAYLYETTASHQHIAGALAGRRRS